MGLAGLDEEGFVFAGSDDLAIEVIGKLGDEDGVRELFEENWGKIEIAIEPDAVALEVFEHAKEREIGLGGSFVEPFHAMGPGAVIDDVRQMRVQGEGEIACGPSCRCLSQDRTPQKKIFLVRAAVVDVKVSGFLI